MDISHDGLHASGLAVNVEVTAKNPAVRPALARWRGSPDVDSVTSRVERRGSRAGEANCREVEESRGRGAGRSIERREARVGVEHREGAGKPSTRAAAMNFRRWCQRYAPALCAFCGHLLHGARSAAPVLTPDSRASNSATNVLAIDAGRRFAFAAFLRRLP